MLLLLLLLLLTLTISWLRDALRKHALPDGNGLPPAIVSDADFASDINDDDDDDDHVI